MIATLRRFGGRVALTSLLVLVEAATEMLFPLCIGLAIDGLLREDTRALLGLGALGAFSLVVGSARRLVDTRTYAEIYETVATQLVAEGHPRGTPVSALTARATLLAELVESLETSMPMLVNAVLGILGTLLILAGIDLRVFWAALALALLVFGVYALTGATNLRLSAGYNDELERQVASLETREPGVARRHFARLMTWNRRLSDLETLEYFVIYLGAIALLVYCPLAVVGGAAPAPTYGFVLATIMYVFQYIESVLELPLFIQQGIRLREISTRLRTPHDP